MIDFSLTKILVKEKLFDFSIWLAMKVCAYGSTYDTLDAARMIENNRRGYVEDNDD